mgnify:CR=1 FL=1
MVLGAAVSRPGDERRDNADMWLGESTHTLDDKGRLSIPRRLLAGQTADSSGRFKFVLTRGFEGCLFLFSESEFERVTERLVTQPFASADMRTMQRLLFSQAQHIELDEKGRFSVSEKLVKLAGLGREVVVIGAGKRAELWAKDRWEAFEREHAQNFDRLDSVLWGERPSDAAGG